MLFHQHLDISRLSGGRIVLEKEKCSLTQIFSTNMSRKSERNKPFVRVDVLNLSLSKNKVFLLNVSTLWLFVFVFVWEHSCFHPAPERQSSDVFPPLANSVLTHSFCSDTHSFLELSFTGLQSSPPLPSNIKQRMYSMNRGDQKNLLKSGKQICILKKGVQLHSARTRCQNVFTQRFVQIRDVMPHRLLREICTRGSERAACLILTTLCERLLDTYVWSIMLICLGSSEGLDPLCTNTAFHIWGQLSLFWSHSFQNLTSASCHSDMFFIIEEDSN